MSTPCRRAKRTMQISKWVGIVGAFCIVIFAVFMTYGKQAHARDSIEGRVVSVADGDSITVLDAQKTTHKIRLSSIDAPEKKQDFGQKSKQSLSDLVYGKDVSVRVVETDRYGRKVGVVYLGRNNINSEQVRRGMAWVYTKYNKDPTLVGIEYQARQAKIGLWSQPNPVPPWKYRRN